MGRGFRLFVLVSVLVLFTGFAAGFTGTGLTGTGGVDGANPYDRYGGIDPGGSGSGSQPSCNDNVDNNGLWAADYNPEMFDGDSTFTSDYDNDSVIEGDPGCSSPYDRTEAAMWDTDLTATVNGLEAGQDPVAGDDPTVFFKGELRSATDIRGTAEGDSLGIEFEDTTGSGVLEERHLGGYFPEAGNGLYSGTGFSGTSESVKTDSVTDYIGASGLSSGSIITDERLVDPPVARNQVSGFSELIGSSYRTCGNGLIDDGFDSVVNVDPTVEGNTLNLGCEEDLGVLDERETEDPVYDSSEFKSTDGDCDDTSGSSTPSAGTEWYEANGDQIITHEWVEGSTSGDCPDGKGGTSSETFTTYSHDKSYYDCNRLNEVRGGMGRSGTPDNDPAATSTDMSAYGDEFNSYVWCQFESTLTVDADGPTGNGDGYVVVEDDKRVVGTKSLDGSNSVGREVHFREDDGSLQKSSTDFLDQTRFDGQWDLDCSGDSNYCIKYLDFYTAGPGSGWSTVRDAVRVRTVEVQGKNSMTPDQSYSVCKLINQVHQDTGGSGEELLDCDFETSTGTGGDVSPLTQACGDESSEGVIVMEGPQVNFGTISKEPYQSQACVKYGGGSADTDAAQVELPGSSDIRDLTQDACVYAGQSFAEGTVRDISNLGSGAERQSSSPDREVCLNDDIDSSDLVQWDNSRNTNVNSQSSDRGGEWYDLDDERVQQYINSNFDAGDYDNQTSRVETFMRENPNPQNDEFNPEGGKTGLALEDDCGNNRFTTGLECEDQQSDESFFYTFFNVVVQ